jgi:prepilin-type N-terminal cleavage/methylation domain-containing protein
MKKRGFTIIEVVLVLAIAGLIFLMVFIALPSLQRSQRDTQREEDISRFMAALSRYSGNNRGNVPTVAQIGMTGGPLLGYLTAGGDTFVNPSGGANYTFTTLTGAQTLTEAQRTANNFGTIYYVSNARCQAAEGTTAAGSGARQVAVLLGLEGGGWSCQNN